MKIALGVGEITYLCFTPTLMSKKYVYVPFISTVYDYLTVCIQL